MSTRHTPPIYTPLSQSSIRVLELFPGPTGSEIHGNLIELSLNNKFSGGYEALSYMWGAQEATSTIFLGGKPFAIRLNLSAALEALRSSGRLRKIWIDAICINQTDVAERNAQVSIMSRVYQQAGTVLVWLGEEDKQTVELFDFILDTEGWTKGRVDEHGGSMSLSNHSSSGDESDFEVEEEQTSYPEFWLDFLGVCSNPYWRRVWIVQEILSSSAVKLLCGASSISLKDFMVPHAALRERLFMTGESRQTMDEIMKSSAYLIVRAYKYRDEGFTLGSLLKLVSSCDSRCQDPRDKIYGVLSLARDVHGIRPDYGKSLLELYFDIMKEGTAGCLYIDGLQGYLKPYSELDDLCILPNLRKIPSAAMRDNSYAKQLVLSLIRVGSEILDNLKQLFQRGDTILLWSSASISSKSATVHPLAAIIDVTDCRGIENMFDEFFSGWKALLQQPLGIIVQSRSGDMTCQLCESCPCQSASFTPGFFNHSLGHNPKNSLWCASLTINALNIEDQGLCQRLVKGERADIPHGYETDNDLKMFLALSGSLGVCPSSTRRGDILCHFHGKAFVVVRRSATYDYLELVGPAMLIQRRNRNDH